MPCDHYNNGRCVLNLFGGKPSPGSCKSCDKNTDKYWPTINKINIEDFFPVPEEKWPLRIKIIAKMRKDKDIGIGDTIESFIGNSNSEKYKELYKEIMGEDCGCNDRKIKLNIKYPYKKDSSKEIKEKADITQP